MRKVLLSFFLCSFLPPLYGLMFVSDCSMRGFTLGMVKAEVSQTFRAGWRRPLLLFLFLPQFGLLPMDLDLPHHFRVARPLYRFLFRLIEYLWVQVVAPLAFGLIFFNRNPVFDRVSVLADASHLPGDFHARPVGFDREAIVADLACDNGLRELADDCQLVAEIVIESLEVIGEPDCSFAISIGCDVAVIDIHHIGRFDEGVVEVFVGWVEGMIYSKRACRLRECALYIHVSDESSRKTIGHQSEASRSQHASAADFAIGAHGPQPGAADTSDVLATHGHYAVEAAAACGDYLKDRASRRTAQAKWDRHSQRHGAHPIPSQRRVVRHITQ